MDKQDLDSDFARAWHAAEPGLNGPPLSPEGQVVRIALWRKQEWHGWFRWWLCRQGFDWSKLIWFVTLACGLALLVAYGLRTARLDITAGGVVAWFTVVNLGFFSYLGLTHRGPPRPVPGPFTPSRRVRAALGLYPPGYDGRKLARIWLQVAKAKEEGAGDHWLFELACPGGLPPELADLCRRQTTFRIQRGDAPLTRAVCETQAVTREELDAGAHPLKVVAWDWDEGSAELFGRPK